MIFEHIADLAQVFARKGGTNAIICPGSRNAPLTLTFSKHPNITCRSISDERSAAFIAMGMAKQSNKPVVLICTSGTASMNFAPAVAEAFFQKIPLLVLTADRPPEWIGQQDGQMIYQENLYGKHVKGSYLFPPNPTHPDELWHCNRISNEAINISENNPKGPVHINIPFREPFYPDADLKEEISFNKETRIIEDIKLNQVMRLRDWNVLGKTINISKNILLIAGTLNVSWRFHKGIEQIPFPIIADITSNLHRCTNAIVRHDSIMLNKHDDLIPDLVISFGDMVLSKSLKQFLRKNKPAEHWHIQEGTDVMDTYQSVTKIIRTSPISFLSELADYDFSIHSADYLDFWRLEQADVNNRLKRLFATKELNEFVSVDSVLKTIHEKTVLHLANSMSIRYASIIGTNKDIEIYSNRGTSGIDGSTSTAVGYAIQHDSLNVLLTGDVAFFYDRNAFWNNYVPANLRIILLNNNGGGIFKLINGPSDQKEVDTFFVTDQKSSASHLASEFGLEYELVDTRAKLDKSLELFFERSKTAKILEISTKIEVNTEFYHQYKELMTDENK